MGTAGPQRWPWERKKDTHEIPQSRHLRGLEKNWVRGLEVESGVSQLGGCEAEAAASKVKKQVGAKEVRSDPSRLGQ